MFLLLPIACPSVPYTGTGAAERMKAMAMMRLTPQIILAELVTTSNHMANESETIKFRREVIEVASHTVSSLSNNRWFPNGSETAQMMNVCSEQNFNTFAEVADCAIAQSMELAACQEPASRSNIGSYSFRAMPLGAGSANLGKYASEVLTDFPSILRNSLTNLYSDPHRVRPQLSVPNIGTAVAEGTSLAESSLANAVNKIKTAFPRVIGPVGMKTMKTESLLILSSIMPASSYDPTDGKDQRLSQSPLIKYHMHKDTVSAFESPTADFELRGLKEYLEDLHNRTALIQEKRKRLLSMEAEVAAEASRSFKLDYSTAERLREKVLLRVPALLTNTYYAVSEAATKMKKSLMRASPSSSWYGMRRLKTMRAATLEPMTSPQGLYTDYSGMIDNDPISIFKNQVREQLRVSDPVWCIL